jgi:hypothetical protein
MKRVFVVVCLALCYSVYAQNDGMPFGQISDADVDRLAGFAKKSGFDLTPEMERVYKKDGAALARLFKFSLTFKTLDANARSYGQIVYSCLLTLGESPPEIFVKVLDRQPPAVQQRVRDFLGYPVLRVPKANRKRVQEQHNQHYPGLFPKTFDYGRNDPMFADKT